MLVHTTTVRKRDPAPSPQARPPRPPAPPRSAPAPERAARLPALQRREAILSTAFPLFARRGLEATTTRELAAAAGVSEPILYRHFPSKEALFDAVFDAAEERILTALQASAGDARGADRIEAISRGLDAVLRGQDREFRLVNGAAATHADARTMRRVRAIYVRIGDFLTAAAAGAPLRRGVSAETAGYLLLEVGLGAALVRPVGVPVIDAEGFRARAMAVLVAGLFA